MRRCGGDENQSIGAITRARDQALFCIARWIWTGGPAQLQRDIDGFFW